jgi:hypothetical protein
VKQLNAIEHILVSYFQSPVLSAVNMFKVEHAEKHLARCLATAVRYRTYQTNQLAVQIDDNTQEQLALVGGDPGNVGHPFGCGLHSVEIALQQALHLRHR